MRLTYKTEEGCAVDAENVLLKDGRAGGTAIERLAGFEDMCEALQAEQEELAGRLEKLRGEGKKNTYQFKELMGKKLTGSNTLLQLKLYGLLPL